MSRLDDYNKLKANERKNEAKALTFIFYGLCFAGLCVLVWLAHTGGV